MKKFISALLLCVVCLVGCGQTETKANYKTDVKTEDIANKILEAVNIDTLTLADNGWVALNISIDLSLCDESAVYINTTSSSDMFGVFKASSEENADKLLDEAKAYLKNLKDNWMSEYLADQFPKIENAVAKKCGLYITFLIFDDTARTSAETEFVNMLKE